MTRNLNSAILMDLANLPATADAIALFQETHPGFIPRPPQGVHLTVRFRTESGVSVPTDVPENLQYVLVLQALVRRLWSGNPDENALNQLQDILISGRLWPGGELPTTQSFKPLPLATALGIDWKRGGFTYRAQTALQQALYELMRESRNAKVCANPDCEHPYFIADRGNIRYCSTDCFESAIRASKRAWWDEIGVERRRKNRTKRKPRRKQ